jgi:hypothetical protein
VPIASWELLTSRCSVKLSPDEVESFSDALRIYPQDPGYQVQPRPHA